MLHTAPTSETKISTEQSKSQLVPQLSQELHPFVHSAAGPYTLSSMRNAAFSPSPGARQHQTLAGMQRTYGNQTVLRMMQNSSQATRMPALRPSQGMMLQRKCTCGGSSEVGGECAECKAKHEEGHEPVSMQAKLQINQPGDQYEQEAERVSDQVMRMAIPGASITSNGNKALVRQVRNPSSDLSTSMRSDSQRD